VSVRVAWLPSDQLQHRRQRDRLEGRCGDLVDLGQHGGEDACMACGGCRVVVRVRRIDLVPEQMHGPMGFGEDREEQVERTAVENAARDGGLGSGTGDEIRTEAVGGTFGGRAGSDAALLGMAAAIESSIATPR